MHAYSDFIAEYRLRAKELNLPRNATPPTKSQYYRWVGDQVGSLPRGHHCLVLESMFPGWTAQDLFGPEQRRDMSPIMDADVLSSIAPALDPTLLTGLWVTCYRVRLGSGLHHLDLSTITVTGSRVTSRNYPPASRFEGHPCGHETDITAQLFARHLLGHFRNRNDSYFFGSLHLAALPGDNVLDGYYTGFLNDTAVVTEPWRWVRVEPQSATGIDLNTISLAEPSLVYDAVAARTGFEGPIPLQQVIENP
jgi:hypothetical protein